jgi:hypothetical protein
MVWTGAQSVDRASFVKQAASSIQKTIEGEEVQGRNPFGCEGRLAILLGNAIMFSVVSWIFEYIFIFAAFAGVLCPKDPRIPFT